MADDVQDREQAQAQALTPHHTHTASLRARLGSASLRLKLAVSTRGLLALTGLVAGTLLSSAVVVAVATRKLPQGTMPARMKRSRW